jgi:PPK2 family polyphosphate:nucleotide phosphotransferase
MNYRKHFAVEKGSRVELGKIDPGFNGRKIGRTEAQPLIEANRQRLARDQLALYAEHKRAVLICLQGMDAAGKDGLISHVLGAMNPLGCRVTSFKQPSTNEREHDFLWRIHEHVPNKGWVGIFNRSHYEAVLVERVRKLVPRKVWSARFSQINDFERMLAESGTVVMKFFLHIGKDEQLKRFKARFSDPMKQWKISEADYTERELWDKYWEAYEDALSKCSEKHAPWYVIPSNSKWFRNLAVSQIIADTLEDLNIAAPRPSVDIEEIRRKYHAAERGG